jgi:hypothetical protein
MTPQALDMYALRATSPAPEFGPLESPSFKSAFDPGLLLPHLSGLVPKTPPEDTIWPGNASPAGATFCNTNRSHRFVELLTTSKDIVNREIC